MKFCYCLYLFWQKKLSKGHISYFMWCVKITVHTIIVCFWKDSNRIFLTEILSDSCFSAYTNRTSVPGQVRVSTLREALEVSGSLFQGGRAQHDFSLAWLEAAWYSSGSDTVRLETSRKDARVLKKLSLAGIAKLSRLKYSFLSFVWP